MLTSLAPLRHRDYALIWSAALVSNVGSWMQTVAVGILVTERTGRPAWTGLVAAAGFLPIGLLSPIGGVLADRFDRRLWLSATTIGEIAFASGLTVLAALGRAGPAAVTLLVFGGASMAAIGFPAYQAMLPDLVPREQLGAAISLSSTQFNLGRAVGPAVAGVAIVAGGYEWAFALNAASFLAVLVALQLVRTPRGAASRGRESVLAQLAAGARATFGDPAPRFAVVAIAVVALTASPFIALVPAMALEALHTRAGGTSLLVTTQGIGAVVGALALTPLARRLGRRRLLLADLVALGASLLCYAAAPDLWWSAAALLVVGASYIGVLAGCSTIVQLHAPGSLRGRMLGIYSMALGICYPVGALVQGWLADRAGVRVVTAAGVGVLLAVAAVAVTAGAVPARLEDPVGRTVVPEPAVPQPAPGPVN